MAKDRIAAFSGPNIDPVTVEAAMRMVLETARKPSNATVALEQALGRVLFAPINANEDFPRYDRITIDGIATTKDAAKIGAKLRIVATQRAGMAKMSLESDDRCIEVMTGSVLPENTGCLIAYEQIRITAIDGERFAEIIELPPKPDTYLHHKGSDCREGDLLIASGTRITAAEIAVAASLGLSQISVAVAPRIAVITTGDELVPIDAHLLPHQIRQSNGYALCGLFQQEGIACDRFHLPDDPATIDIKLAEWTAQYDALIFSGGVSKGVADFLPAALENIGVKALFHGVSQRPGKPFWFGAKPGGVIVFALPGNPVSSFLCALKYCLPWLEKSVGVAASLPVYAKLTRQVEFKPPLTYFLPVNLFPETDGALMAESRPLNGSGDYTGLLRADGFIELPAGRSAFEAGETYKVLRYR